MPAPALWAVAAGVGATPLVLRLVRDTTLHRRDLSVVETAAVTVLAGLTTVAAASGRTPAEAIGVGAAVLIALAASVVDAGEQRLPNPLTARLVAATVIAVAVRCAAAGDAVPFGRALLGALLVGGGLLLVKVVDDGAVGWGDVKFTPSLAALVVAEQPGGLIAAGLLTVAAIGVSAAGIGLVDRTSRTPVPYGPGLLAGACAGLTVGL